MKNNNLFLLVCLFLISSIDIYGQCASFGGGDISGLQPPAVTFIESTCNSSGIASGGSVVPDAAGIAAATAAGLTVQFFDFTSNTWTATPPTYNQSQSITVRVRVACTSDLTQTGIPTDFISNPATCTPIPTMSEWGLIIFCLLILNLSISFVKRKELSLG